MDILIYLFALSFMMYTFALHAGIIVFVCCEGDVRTVPKEDVESIRLLHEKLGVKITSDDLKHIFPLQ